jgi:hypothetical protein
LHFWGDFFSGDILVLLCHFDREKPIFEHGLLLVKYSANQIISCRPLKLTVRSKLTELRQKLDFFVFLGAIFF